MLVSLAKYIIKNINFDKENNVTFEHKFICKTVIAEVHKYTEKEIKMMERNRELFNKINEIPKDSDYVAFKDELLNAYNYINLMGAISYIQDYALACLGKFYMDGNLVEHSYIIVKYFSKPVEIEKCPFLSRNTPFIIIDDLRRVNREITEIINNIYDRHLFSCSFQEIDPYIIYNEFCMKPVIREKKICYERGQVYFA
jgi:hypothetical protein